MGCVPFLYICAILPSFYQSIFVYDFIEEQLLSALHLSNTTNAFLPANISSLPRSVSCWQGAPSTSRNRAIHRARATAQLVLESRVSMFSSSQMPVNILLPTPSTAPRSLSG